MFFGSCLFFFMRRECMGVKTHVVFSMVIPSLYFIVFRDVDIPERELRAWVERQALRWYDAPDFDTSIGFAIFAMVSLSPLLLVIDVGRFSSELVFFMFACLWAMSRARRVLSEQLYH
jgi:hypothetical protein